MNRIDSIVNRITNIGYTILLFSASYTMYQLGKDLKESRIRLRNYYLNQVTSLGGASFGSNNQSTVEHDCKCDSTVSTNTICKCNPCECNPCECKCSCNPCKCPTGGITTNSRNDPLEDNIGR